MTKGQVFRKSEKTGELMRMPFQSEEDLTLIDIIAMTFEWPDGSKARPSSVSMADPKDKVAV